MIRKYNIDLEKDYMLRFAITRSFFRAFRYNRLAQLSFQIIACIKFD